MEHYTRLSFSERYSIHMSLCQNIGVTQMAKQLDRHRSTLYRELKRNQSEGTSYRPHHAHALAKQRHTHRTNKLDTNPELKKYLINRLRMGWSPEQISGRMKQEKKEFYICPESIYRYVYQNKSLGLYKLLPRKQSKRYAYSLRRHNQKRAVIANKNIALRDKGIDLRQDFGHWEGDTILFYNNKRTCVTTLVERKSRFVCLRKNQNKKSEVVFKSIYQIIKAVPKKLWRTLTLDQGSEFMNFRLIEQFSRCKIYFCDAHSPWQRGSNENMNGRLRRYLPKKLKIEEIEQKELDAIAKNMNNTPRKCLGYLTPKEVACQHWKKFCRIAF